MNSKVTYHQQVSYCGKPRCRKCREGTGHGPYWYAYKTVDGRTSRTYVGKQLPPEVQASMEGAAELPPVQSSEQEQSSSTIRIYVLGQFRLERRNSRDASEWQTVTDSAWQHQRVRALLGCLVSSPGRKLGREQIMDALWPDLDIETAGSRLDRAVYSLRQLFEPSRSRLATSPLLLTEREVLVLADQSHVWIDADAFENHLAQAHASTDPGETERLFEEAMTLYGGDFLPEERKLEWTLARRESLQRSWVGLLLDLSDRRREREAFVSAIEPLDRLLSLDPTNEAAVQRLIVLLGQLGRRGEAMRAYKRLATVLQQEYRIAPLPETRALYEKVRQSGQTPSAPVTQSPTQSTSQRDLARQDAPTTMQIGRSHQYPLVGRNSELDFLRDLVSTTENTTRLKLTGQKKTASSSLMSALDTQRRAQCVLLMGEVGIGKTRLAEEVSREAKKRNWAVAWSRVYAQEGSIPYRLWTEVLKKAMAQGAWQRQEVSRRPLVFQPLCALLPELQTLLPQVSLSSSLPAEQEQLRLWEAALELLTLISEGGPLLIALDDLQWADASSCELLAYLARRLQGHPIVIVGTCRDNELTGNHPLRSLLTDLQREHAVETLSLEPLSDEQISALVSQIPHLPEPMVQRIRTRAAGNPFFAEELARSLGTQDSGEAASANGDALTNLPDTITAVLDLRLGRLSAACQRLLSKAAVLGGEFEFQIISEMEASTAGSDEDAVLDLLEEALKSGMLTEEGTGTRITYHFWHPLLVSHLYEKLSAARRASQHRRAAAILQKAYQGREAEGAAMITHHLVNGGADSQQIVHYAELAGDRAYTLSAFPDAERHYRLALEHLEAGTGTATRRSTEEQLHLASLFELLGDCTRIQGNNEEARDFYKRALEIRRLLSAKSLGSEHEHNAQVQALLWHEIGKTWFNTGDTAQARQCYERGEQVLQEARITKGTAWANIRLQQSYVSSREGKYEDARRTSYEALKLFEAVIERPKDDPKSADVTHRLRHSVADDSISLGRTHMLLGLIANGAGQSAEALEHLNMALALYEQYDREREIAIVCCNLGDLHLRKADYKTAQAFLRRSLHLAERIGERQLVGVVTSNLGVLAIRSGDPVEAETLFKKSLVLAEQTNDRLGMSLWNTVLATALQDQGQLDEARSHLYQALAISRSIHITPCIGFALVALGNMRLVQASTVLERTSSKHLHWLQRAKKTLQHALAYQELEAETRTEGRIALASTLLLLGETEPALQLAQMTLEEAQQFELKWLIASAQRLLGIILATRAESEPVEHYFKQALQTFRKSGMQLEYARTLQQYGLVLLQRAAGSRADDQQGLEYLQEAKKIFAERRAALDLQTVDHALSHHETAVAH